MSLTEKQKRILNNLGKYDPAWRGFAEAGGPPAIGEEPEAFGDLMGRAEGPTGARNLYQILVAGMFSSGNSQVLGIIPAGARIIACLVTVLERFNPEAILVIGTEEDSDQIFAEEDAALDEEGTYFSSPGFIYEEDTTLKALVTGATQGKMSILLTY